MPAALTTFDLPMRMRFRGLSTRQGMVWRGDVGWAEWSPFLDYDGPELVPWWRAAREAADLGWPAPVRDTVPVNATVPAVDPVTAHALVRASGCRTAKVKVAERGQSLAQDVARVEAVRDALGPTGHVRVDANGGWSVDEALVAVRQLDAYALQYVEQPCRTVEELADLRRRLARAGRAVPIAADESIRRAEDPYRVVALEAADVAVLKVQPLGGVRACLQIAERIGLPVVVSSALETSVGIAAGLALAGCLPDLPYACGLNTVPLLAGDLVADPLEAREGMLRVGPVEVDPARLAAHRAPAAADRHWRQRLERTRTLVGERGTAVGGHGG